MPKNIKQLLSGIIDIDEKDNCVVFDITNDSRNVQPGSLFLACMGEKIDGRDFITEAVQKDAAAVFYQSDTVYSNLPQANIPIIPVPKLDCWQGELAARFFDYPSQNMMVIGVTGTNGKTSCTHFIAQALREYKISCAVMGTLGNGFLPNLSSSPFTTEEGVNLQRNLAKMQAAGAQVIAMEVSSHALMQHRVDAVNFDIAVFTQLSQDHLDYHKTMEEYGNAKSRLFQHPELKAAVINADDSWGRKFIQQSLAANLDVLAYSIKTSSIDLNVPVIYAKKIVKQDKLTRVEVETPWGSGAFTTGLLGQFNVSNLLAVLGVLGRLQIPLPKILEFLSHVVAVPGRMQRLGKEGQPLVVVDYSHTPDALEKTLLALREQSQGKIWCVFGCGGNRDRSKRSQMAAIAETLSDYVIVTNDNPRHESPDGIVEDIFKGFTKPENIPIILDRALAIEKAVQSAEQSDVVLIAGKGHETYQILGDRTFPFSDVKEAEKQLEDYGNRKEKCL